MGPVTKHVCNSPDEHHCNLRCAWRHVECGDHRLCAILFDGLVGSCDWRNRDCESRRLDARSSDTHRLEKPALWLGHYARLEPSTSSDEYSHRQRGYCFNV